jgi:hypothetical protein
MHRTIHEQPLFCLLFFHVPNNATVLLVQSQAFAEAIYRYPILVDAVCNEMERKGDAMMAAWAEVATCMRPKSYFFRPDVALPLGFALLREVWAQKVRGRPSRYTLLPAETAGNGAVNGKHTANGNGRAQH